MLEYEVWTRTHGRRLAGSHGESVRALIGRVALVELAPPVLSRALEPFARPVRTLDALHLASMEFLRTQGQTVELATYDARLAQAARDLKVPLRSEEHTSELQSRLHLVCRLLLEKKKTKIR